MEYIARVWCWILHVEHCMELIARVWFMTPGFDFEINNDWGINYAN